MGRTPRWVRGLKSFYGRTVSKDLLSHPTMGAWIEISRNRFVSLDCLVAPHDGCVDWNHMRDACLSSFEGRTPRWVRGLKSCFLHLTGKALEVAPHDGCVDWNDKKTMQCYFIRVAPHDGCVDWNFTETIPNGIDTMGRTPRWVRGLKLWQQQLLDRW